LSTVLVAAAEELAAAGVDSARSDAEWLLAESLGARRLDLCREPGRRLSPGERARFEQTLRRRIAREPLQQILGWEDFHGVRVRLTDAVMVPRPETEVLAAWALELLPPQRPGARPLVLDVGTGSGCLACAIARAREDVAVVAVDVSPAAARVADGNVRALALGERVRVVVADLAPALARPVDLVVANPPYLPSALLDTLPPEVARHEPRLALDGGPDGLAVIRRIVALAGGSLVPGGALALETAGDEQVDVVAALLEGAGFAAVETRRDLVGRRRHVAARRRGGP
jgi:release factor glutamine methyltransferase